MIFLPVVPKVPGQFTHLFNISLRLGSGHEFIVGSFAERPVFQGNRQEDVIIIWRVAVWPGDQDIGRHIFAPAGRSANRLNSIWQGAG